MKAGVHRTGIVVAALMLVAWSACASGAPTVVGIEGASSSELRVGRGDDWAPVRTSTRIAAEQFLRIPQGTIVSVRLPNGEVAKLEGKAVIPGRRLAQKAARADAVMRFARAVRTVSVAIGGEETGHSGPGATKIEALPSGGRKALSESDEESRTKSAAPAAPAPPPPPHESGKVAKRDLASDETIERKQKKAEDSSELAGLALSDEFAGAGAGAGAEAEVAGAGAGIGTRSRTEALREDVAQPKVAVAQDAPAPAAEIPPAAANPPDGIRSGWTAAQEGRFPDALARFRQAPDDPDALVGIGFVHLQMGESQEAGVAFRKAIAAAGDGAVPAARRAHFYLGLIALEAGDEAAAKGHFAEASADPSLAEAIRTLTGQESSGQP